MGRVGRAGQKVAQAFRPAIAALKRCATYFIVATTVAFAQQLPVEQNVHIRYNAGQDIVPVYEGWERVADGSFNMVFGYLNRNHVQELSLSLIHI